MIKYFFSRHAEKELFNLPKNVQQKIISKIEFYLQNENPLVYAKHLAGLSDPVFRFRVDDYRVIFDWKKDYIVILKIGHRKDIYR